MKKKMLLVLFRQNTKFSNSLEKYTWPMGKLCSVSFICHPSLLQVSIQMERKVWGSCKHGLRMSEFYAWRKSHFSWFTRGSKHSELQGVPLLQPSWSFLFWRSLKAWLSEGEPWTWASILIKLDMWWKELSWWYCYISLSGPRLHTESQWSKATFL